MRLALFFFIMFGQAHLLAISVVYNFRIAQITKRSIHELATGRNNTFIGLFFEEYLKNYDGDYQNYLAGFGSYIRSFSPSYFRVDFAASYYKAVSDKITIFSGTKTGDLLLSGGRSFLPNQNIRLTLSGLFGIPTHKIYTLQYPDFGYNQIGIGAQIDGSYKLTRSSEQVFSDLLFGARYVYFVPRTALNSLDEKFTFTIGNIADLLFSYRKNWGNPGFELGYDVRFNFGADIDPALDDVVKKTNYIKHNFYLVYSYRFVKNDILNQLLWYIAYSFDSSPKLYGNKNIITFWTSWGISF